MEQRYKSNSNRSKEQASEKKIEKVATGKVTAKKKSGLSKAADSFIQKDVSDVGNFLIAEIIVPHFKKIISDVITNTIDMLLYGETRGKGRGNTNASKVNYRAYYERRDERDRRDGPAYRPRTNYDFYDIEFDERADAEEVLDGMHDIIHRYDGVVSVFDLCELAGVESYRHTDNKYGWTDLSNAYVERTRGGKYIIRLPRAIPID